MLISIDKDLHTKFKDYVHRLNLKGAHTSMAKEIRRFMDGTLHEETTETEGNSNK